MFIMCPSPYTCAQLYHVGSRSQTQVPRPCPTSPEWQISFDFMTVESLTPEVSSLLVVFLSDVFPWRCCCVVVKRGYVIKFWPTDGYTQLHITTWAVKHLLTWIVYVRTNMGYDTLYYSYLTYHLCLVKMLISVIAGLTKLARARVDHRMDR